LISAGPEEVSSTTSSQGVAVFYEKRKSMSTTENLLLGFGALVVWAVVWYFDLRSDWEYWKEYFRSTRKVYWVSLGCWALLFLLVYLWVVL